MARKRIWELLPDTQDSGTRFVMLVVVMMTFLATLAVGGALVVSALRATWVDAVEGHITIEIPASDGAGVIRNADTLSDNARGIANAVGSLAGIKSVHVLSRVDIKNLVKPWMGEAAGTEDMPLPALMGVTLRDPDDTGALEAITKAAKALDAAAIVEAHQSWISDLRRFSLVLLLAACAMAFVTIACCIVAVTGAVAARLSEHHADIDLLHLMGATDDYIGGQFVQSVVRSVGGAALAGTVIGLVLLKAGALIAGNIQTAMLPQAGFGFADYVAFAGLPALVTGLCFAAARFTVLRSLRQMP
ncbi:MAG: hypothetical protein KGQ41_04775 [Alphaproteobacteria bacterium]|nr:hypothetical protein [Alphaproteobacteria bacterium]